MTVADCFHAQILVRGERVGFHKERDDADLVKEQSPGGGAQSREIDLSNWIG